MTKTLTALPPIPGDAHSFDLNNYQYRTKTSGEHSATHNDNREYPVNKFGFFETEA
jgi:hypothetical protein